MNNELEEEEEKSLISDPELFNENSLNVQTILKEETKRNNLTTIFDTTQQETLIEDIYSELIDDVLFGSILQIHRAAKLGYLFYMDPDSDPEFEKQFDIYDDNDVLGVFSHLNENFKVSGKKDQGSNANNNNLIKYECVCPNCDRNVAAIRFAPHLEKCMGMGRSSSRIATRRIANYNGDELDQLIEATGMIPNHHRSNDSYSSSKTNDNDLISIINSVATASSLPLNSEQMHASSSCSSVVDVDVSSNSSSCSTTNSNLKPRAAKKRKAQKMLNNINIQPAIPVMNVTTNVSTNSTTKANNNNGSANGSNLRTNSYY